MNGSNNGTIIAAVIGVLVLVGVLSAVMAVKRAIYRAKSSLSGQLLSAVINELDQEKAGISLSQQPKSISDMTSVYGPMIAKDFPDLNLQQLISAAQTKLCSALYAISLESGGQSGAVNEAVGDGQAPADESSLLGVTVDYATLLQRTVENLAQAGKSECYERLHVHKSGIYSYVKNAGTCHMTIQTAMEYVHYVKQSGKVIAGNPGTLVQSKYNLELIYIIDEKKLASSQTTALGVTCPNCGAPASQIGANKHCEYCGSALQTIDMRVWRLNQFKLLQN